MTFGSLKKKRRSKNNASNSEDAVAGAESAQNDYISPLKSPAPTESTWNQTSIEDARRTSAPSALSQPLSSPSRLNHRANSTFDVAVRSRSRSSNRAQDPLGLTVIYQPETSPPLDIIFVHGLGGTSRATWSKGRNPEFFWPEKWLPTEPAISSARILSFGYNANFAATGPTPITGIVDFAKELLYAMKFAKDGELNELELGKRPIIFIVHSMGGLVVKQAYILGQNDENYSELVSSISAILFLATPHRGSDLAEILNRILTVSIFNHSPKLYVGELKHGSPTIQALNEQFRHIAPKLDILSFYETLQTAVGPKKMMVVERQSATLGYPAEISKSLMADHHTVCKYDSIHDINYISIRNALKTLVTTIKSKGHHLLASQSKPEVEELETLLAVSENYRQDLDFFRKRWTTGTCEWILHHPAFQKWKSEGPGSMMLWLNALPASGKTILSSYVISHLLEESFCAFYFFRFGDQVKRSTSTCLRTIIYQLAEQLPRFRAQLREIRFPSKTLEKTDARTIWEKVFVNVIFKMGLTTTMYWVIDALDESDSPQLLVELMQGISQSTSPIRVLLVSRRDPELVSTFDRLSIVVPMANLSIEDTKRDIRAYVEAEVRYMRGTEEYFKEQIVERLVAGANGNFLWVSLALVEVLTCNTEEDLDETLESIPSGMDNLYRRMEQSIIASTKPRDQKLGHMILTWAVCARRPLLLKEISQALQPEHSIMTDLSHSVNRVCGQFVTIDSTDRLVIVHQTARDHLIATNSLLAVNVPKGHEILFSKCILVLESKQSKQPRRHSDRRGGSTKAPDYQDFLHYATVSWNYHLNLLSSESNGPLLLLAKFLNGPAVLHWIESLAKKNLLKILVYSSKAMTSYVRRKRNRNTDTNPLEHRIQELDLVESWAIDLLKIIGKFGPNLTATPTSIYHQIPPFCPQNTALFKHYANNSPKPHSLTVSGVERKEWDDNLARISLDSGMQALIVATAGSHIAVVSTVGQTSIYDSATFELKRLLKHTENISAMGFSDCTKLLATYGYKTTKVWSIETGLVLHEIPNPQRSRAFTIAFADGDTELMIGSNDRLIRTADLAVPCPAWIILHPSLLKDDTVLDRPVHNVPWRIAFSPDREHVAVAYRNFPLSVWSLDDDRPELIGRLMRDEEYAGNSWSVVDQVTWHPSGESIVGLYLGGHVFRWDLFQNNQQELQAEASVLACSPEGNFFAVGTSDGTIKLYNYHHFALVYQLSCDSMIHDLCFSPDGKRIYDVRGQYCNVWEPNALIRWEDGGEQDSEERSEVASIPTLAVSEAFTEARDQITATAIQFQGRYQALGNESGSISIIDTSAKAPRPVQIWQASVPLGIGFLAWSDDGNHLAWSDLTGRAVVKRVERSVADTWNVTAMFDVKVPANSEGLHQILLNSDGSVLMMKNGPSAMVWAVEEIPGQESNYTAIESSGTKWIKHPLNPLVLLAVDCTHIRLHRWKDLSEVAVISLLHAPMQAGNIGVAKGDPEEGRLVAVFADPAGSHCIIDMVRSTPSGPKRITSLFTFASLNKSVAGHGHLQLDALPDKLQQEFEIMVGVLPRQRLVFLDTNFWMCSLPLSQPLVAASVQRHYYLPKDWLNAKYLDHCAILRDGKFLVPNNGEIAIVACTELCTN